MSVRGLRIRRPGVLRERLSDMNGDARPGTRGEVAKHWRDRLGDGLRSAGVEPPDADGPGPARDWLGHHLAAEPCAARAYVVHDDFEESASTAARAIALTALAGRSTGDDLPTDRVNAVLEVPEDLRPSLAEWLRGLDRAGTAAVAAAATAWLVDAVALGHRRGDEPAWQDPRTVAFKPKPWGVSLAASCDAVRASPAGINLLVVRRRASATDARLARRVALVWALVTGQVPASVVLGHRDSLQRDRHPVDDPMMEVALQDAVLDIGWAIAPSGAPVVPNSGCRHCPLLDSCEDGMAHEDLFGGAPFPPIDPLVSLQSSEPDPTM